MKFLPMELGAATMIVAVILASALAGMLYSLLLAVAAINFKADQTITGTAMNMLATAAATVGVKAMNTAASGGNDVSSDISYVHSKDLFLVRLGNFEFSWFMLVAVICLVASYVLLYKTKFGLRLRACGEHPQAADSVGINVYKMRYAGTTISGALAGMGDFVYSLTTANCTANGSVAGFGFLALAVMIFGNWKPLNILGASLFFALFRVIGSYSASLPFLPDFKNIKSSEYIYLMLPYFVTMILLVITGKKSRAPKAEGIPYDKGSR
jgi:simple sugar transport system permease protein